MALGKRPVAAGVTALLFSSYFFSSWLSALGVGDIELHSALNEPLDAVIRLNHVGELGEAEIIAGLASPQDFVAAGMSREPILSELAFKLDFSDPVSPLLRVISQRPIREPYLDFLVDVQWPAGRVLREFTLLLDLPAFSAGHTPNTAQPAPAALAPAIQAAAPPATPPAAAPAGVQRDTGPLAVRASLAPGQSYTVSAGDTLWNIAERLPGDASMQNKIAAIRELNPAAFIDGDISRLRRGEVLRVPAMGAESSRPAAEPDRGEEPASRPDTPVPGAVETVERSATTGASTENKAALAPAVATGLASVNADMSRQEWQDIQDELARVRQQNTELKDRLGSFEEELAALREVVALSDKSSMAPASVVAVSTVDASDEVSDGQQEAGTLAATPPEVAAPTSTGWLATMGSYLVFIFGFLVVLIGALVIAVLRKRERVADRYDQNPSAEYLPAGAGNGSSETLQREQERVPAVSSLDDIDLHEDDDFFARPEDTAADIRQLFVDDDLAGEGDLEPSPSPTAQSFADEVPPQQPAWPQPFAEAPLPEDSLLEESFPEDSLPEESVSKGSLGEEPLLEEPLLEEPLADTAVAGRPAAVAYSPAAPAPASAGGELDDDEIEDLELDLSELELNDIFSEPAPEPVTVTPAGNPLELDDFDFGDTDENDTQLELAEVYLDMGDNASAREILQEVLAAGSDKQKARAEALSARLR